MKRTSYLAAIELQFQVHPICALLGPRQVGKTTLARLYVEKYTPEEVIFFDLEDPIDLGQLDNPMTALSKLSQQLIVIDEIQRRPELFPVLRVLVDRKERQQKFLILGSASRDLIQQSSETLAGRIGYIELAPFSLLEVKEGDRLWLRGGFPEAYLAATNQASVIWRQNYIKTFLERDIPMLGFSIPAQTMRRFWMMLANYHGQTLNASELARSLAISDHSVRKYIDILVGTFMVRALEPWFENISKRQVKAPKIYFRDSGVLNTLIGIDSKDQLRVYSKLGALWEGFALEEIIRTLNAEPEECYFWATHADAELDLLIMKHGKRLGFEFKYADAPKPTKSMRIVLEDLKLDHLFVIYPGDKIFSLEKNIDLYGLETIATGEFLKNIAKVLKLAAPVEAHL
jgi:uncharacterized protein